MTAGLKGQKPHCLGDPGQPGYAVGRKGDAEGMPAGRALTLRPCRRTGAKQDALGFGGE